MTDPVEAHQRLAAGPTTCVGAQVLVQRGELNIQRGDHPKRGRDLLARGGRQREAFPPLATLLGQKTNAAVVRTTVVVEHRMNPLLPLAALVDQRVAQPNPRAQIEDVIGRDPRLRQATDPHQLAQQPGVSAIGLRALLASPPRGGLRRLGQMHGRANPA
jgi:hypothetical protein